MAAAAMLYDIAEHSFGEIALYLYIMFYLTLLPRLRSGILAWGFYSGWCLYKLALGSGYLGASCMTIGYVNVYDTFRPELTPLDARSSKTSII